jgi:two-component system, OmpR family, sensor histidine kinase KdpD
MRGALCEYWRHRLDYKDPSLGPGFPHRPGQRPGGARALSPPGRVSLRRGLSRIGVISSFLSRMLQFSRWSGTFSKASYLDYGASLLLPIAAAIAANLLNTAFGVEHLSFVFMTSVIIAGVWLGAAPALVAALFAFVAYNFYLVEPRYSLRLVSAGDFLALILFLFAALLTGALAGRVRDNVITTARRLRVTRAFFETSQRLAREMSTEAVYSVIAEGAARASGGRAVVLRPLSEDAWTLKAAAPPHARVTPAEMREIARVFAASAEAGGQDQWRVSGIEGRAGLLGLVAVEQDKAHEAENERIAETFSGLGAVAIERSLLINEIAAAEASVQSERLRSALLSSLSHDFRTPLSTILASSTSLIDYGQALAPEVRTELLGTIREETVRMSRFVSNLLEMTRLESGALQPRLVEAEVGDVALDAISHLAQRASALGVSIQRSGPGGLARVDPVLLEQALVNLLDNAVKVCSGGGQITVDVVARNERVQISVVDTGPGIPEEALGHVFEKFWRLSEEKSNQKGVGLGLAIAKGLIEAMDGEVTVRSPVDGERGARFDIFLRAAEVQRDE